MRQLTRAVYLAVLALTILVSPWSDRHALAQADCAAGRDLLSIPEIQSDKGRLRAEIRVTSGLRALWGSAGDQRCVQQDLRYITGHDLLRPGGESTAFAMGEPVPGPTLRARVGDLIQIRFLNQVDTQAFANSLDQAMSDQKNTTGCDEVYTEGRQLYPGNRPGGDTYPNCLHGSSTTNMHFHGTHTTPSTTGDNVLLFVRPAIRDASRNIIGPTETLTNQTFDQTFSDCEKTGSPVMWEQLPATWRTDQQRLLEQYDATTPYKGESARKDEPPPLPPGMRLWPVNDRQIRSHVWPQYQIGAFPYCFRLADAADKDIRMGQAPGTHWYHAHKHGSTALNVANGMTGALVIEGQYDTDLRAFYGQGLHDQVLMIQQLSSTPFPVLNPARKGRDPSSRPILSVNGRVNPVVRMRPGEVQQWRLINSSFRDAVQLVNFTPANGLAWRQIAQDGVQFAFENYESLGLVNNPLNLAPANRADLLVKAPATPGKYDLIVQPNEGLPNGDPTLPKSPQVTLLTVNVEGPAVTPAQDFILDKKDFPVPPKFLDDIPASEALVHRTLTFGAAHNKIDGKSFDGDSYSQIMALNSVEEWKVENQANDKAHPFHIHINPFQITEVFQPNAADINTTDPTKPCYVNPLNPETWKPCSAIPGPFVWWDTFAIPMARKFDATAACTRDGKTEPDLCPPAIQPYVNTCPPPQKGSQNACTLTMPGYFRMRTRFADFTGSYVVHCHILIHEDRGMMQLVEVVPNRPPYVHH